MTLLDFKNGDEIARLPCTHIFGRDPILKWLKEENASCPVCREKIDSKEIKKDIPVVNLPQGPPLPALSGMALLGMVGMHGIQIPGMQMPGTAMPIPMPIMSIPMTHNSSVGFINALVDHRLRREEDNDIQRAILASLN